MIVEFTDVTEFKRLIEEKKIKHERVKTYLKNKGILFTSTNAETFAEQMYTIFLGCQEMTEITEMFQTDANYEKSLMLKAKPKSDLPADTNIIDFFVDEIARFRSTKSIYQIEQPARSEDSEQLFVSASYEKRSQGKNKLMQTERRTLKFSLRQISRNEVTIDIRQLSSSDTTETIKLLKQIAGKPEDSLFSFIHIDLLSLPAKVIVEFFDRLMANEFPLWKLQTITGITLKKSNSVNDEDDENEDDEDENEGDVPEEALIGISQAALKGNGLRNNQFVTNTLAEGYLISSMRFRYSCKLEAEEFQIVVSCKGSDLRIDIDKTYYEEGNRVFASPFSKNRQDEIIQAFQDAANLINLELRRELSEAALSNA